MKFKVPELLNERLRDFFQVAWFMISIFRAY